MRSCSALQVNRDMQIITTMWYYFIPTREASKSNKTENVKGCWGCGAIKYLVYLVSCLKVSYKVNVHLPYESTSTFGYLFKKCNICSQKDLSRNAHSNLIHNDQKMDSNPNAY